MSFRNVEANCNCYGVSAQNLVCPDCGCEFMVCPECKELSPDPEWIEDHECARRTDVA